jgi:hypothetical protein
VLTFAVVASQTGQPLDPGSLDLFEARAEAEVSFSADRQVTWRNDSGTVWFTGWQAPSAGPRQPPSWHVDADGLTAYAGRVWPRRHGWAAATPIAAQLAQHVRSHPLVASADELAGVYIVAAMNRRGSSAVAADPVGAGLLYWAHGADVIVLSSRAAIAAALLAAATGTAPRRDVLGAGWVAYAGWSLGAQSGYEHVSVVPDGTVVDIDPAGAIRTHRPSRPVWRLQAEDLAADPMAALEEVRVEIRTAIRTTLSHPGRQGRVGLTGGKDSRLILGLLLADGLASDLEYETFGSDDLPDMMAARELAASFGLRHVTRPRIAERWAWRQRVDEAVRDNGLPDCPPREIAFRISAWATSGMTNAAEPHLGRLPLDDGVLLSGLFGESLRTDYHHTTGLCSKAEAAGFPDRLKFGAAGVLTRDAATRYRAQVHDLLFEGAIDTDSPQDVIDTFYLRQRLRRWLGGVLEINSDNRDFPLYSITAMRLAFGIGAANRHAEWIHYRLLKGACEPLLHVPFTGRDWPPGASGALMIPSRYKDPVPPCPPSSQHPRVVRQQFAGLHRQRALGRSVRMRTAALEYRAKSQVADVEVMRRMFRHDPANPAFEIIDAGAAQRAADGFDTLSERQQVQLYGALAAVIWLGGHEVALPRDLMAA